MGSGTACGPMGDGVFGPDGRGRADDRREGGARAPGRGGEQTAAWRQLLEDLTQRGLGRP